MTIFYFNQSHEDGRKLETGDWRPEKKNKIKEIRLKIKEKNQKNRSYQQLAG